IDQDSDTDRDRSETID
ncbi:unnamed protein product, partial [Rotaria magnacalcarata]